MNAKKLSYKEYEELLKNIRLWIQPYRNQAAKLILHLRWQFDEIKRLEDELRAFKQQSLLDDKNRTKEPYKPFVAVEPRDKWPLAKRLADIKARGAQDEWAMTLKWNGLSEDQALDLIRPVNELYKT